ncbi:hypothetical protein [Piscinibacter sp.]|uniref:hypothetical protein n=1 Tax=Piscinibacter sp. TaxID=1903157 RepID=UPI002BFEC0DB|nr:hypothetical protein [Albitalea sp.]HUG25065.1 hypothetical protein [Albitalea sp.]
MKPLAASLLAAMLAVPLAQAKLPPPPPEAQASAAQAKLKADWTSKVAAYQLCRSMDRVAESYRQNAKATGKEAKPPVPTPPCTDPGAFVEKPLEASGAHSPAATAATPPSSNATQAQIQGKTK